MPTVAERLRTARETKNLSLHQVAEATKIRTDHIRALEAGDYDVFAAPVYIRGFTRTYATLLKLDVPAVMAELEGELGHTEKFSEPPALVRHETSMLDVLTLKLSRVHLRGVLGLLIAIVILGATVGAFIAWRKHARNDSTEDISDGLYHPAGQPRGEMLPVPPPGQRR